MAKKTYRGVEAKIKAILDFRYNCLIRLPDYKSNFEKYAKWHSGNGENIKDADIFKILERYGLIDLQPPNSSQGLQGFTHNRYSILPNDTVFELLFQTTSKEPVAFKVDIWRDKEIIKKELSEWIDHERKKRVAAGFKSKCFDKTLNLENAERYFAVFDLRNQKPPLDYQQIVLKLKKYYPQCNLNKAINLAKKDYQRIFKEIFGVPLKDYNKEQFNTADHFDCKQCNSRSICKQPCSQIEHLLSLEVVKQKHFIGDKDVGEWEGI